VIFWNESRNPSVRKLFDRAVAGAGEPFTNRANLLFTDGAQRFCLIFAYPCCSSPSHRMRDDLPLGDERLKRPSEQFRYTFEHFARLNHLPQREPMPDARENHVIPIEAAADGDSQVIAARPMTGPNNLIIDLDPLSSLPSVSNQ
jgi:hypothetical protein